MKLALALAVALLAAAPAAAQDPTVAEAQELFEKRYPSGFYLTAELHSSILSDVRDDATLAPTMGWGAKFGHRWNRWGLFATVEQNAWFQVEGNIETQAGVINAAIGGEILFGNGLARSSIAVGTSTLIFETILDEIGATGVFFEIRGVGVRLPIGGPVHITIDPLTFAIAAPVTTGVQLVRLQYRTYIGFEFAL